MLVFSTLQTYFLFYIEKMLQDVKILEHFFLYKKCLKRRQGFNVKALKNTTFICVSPKEPCQRSSHISTDNSAKKNSDYLIQIIAINSVF